MHSQKGLHGFFPHHKQKREKEKSTRYLGGERCVKGEGERWEGGFGYLRDAFFISHELKNDEDIYTLPKKSLSYNKNHKR